jgi:peptidoglycan/xylan/chitin deacetylase (PgdA/CDA1 family)
MESSDLAAAYQWNYRPRTPRRPVWFTAWPGGNRIAFSISVMHEWESDPGAQTVKKRAMAKGLQRIDFLALGAREYGVNFGLARLLDVLDRCGVKATILSSGLTAELFPATLAETLRRGHEVACHHWDQSRHPYQYETREEEEKALADAIAAIARAAGERPTGYMSPGPRPSPFTLELSAALGFTWSGDYCDSDVPYIIDINGRRLVSIGYVRPAYTDNDIQGLGHAGALRQLKDEFDAHYEESLVHPMKFRYAVHTFTGGRPGFAKVLEHFLDYVKSRSGVWFCRADEMADFWLQQTAASEGVRRAANF